MADILAQIAGKICTLLGYDGTYFRNLLTDASGHMQVDVLSSALPTGAAIYANQVLAATPTVYNLTLTLANTEYSQLLPTYCRRFEFHIRSGAVARFAFTLGKVATPTEPYVTLGLYESYDSGVYLQTTSPSYLYFASATAGAVVEIIAWV